MAVPPISPIGWLHTLGSLPAIPFAAWMVARHGRIIPGSPAGRAYLGFMLLGALTVYPIAHEPISKAFATLTLVALLAGYGLSRLAASQPFWRYVQTASLSLSVFLLMLPTTSEILRRLPAGHPFVTDMKDPLLLGAQGALLLALLVGVPLQIRSLVRQARLPAMSKVAH
jgi:hypothetical protein